MVQARWISALAVVASFAAVVFVFTRLNDPMLHGPVDYDESYFVWGGWCITKGLVPYRDFMEFKPPFVFITHALAQAIFGYDGFRYRYFFLLFPMTALIALHAAMLSRRIRPLFALALVLAIMQLWVNHTFHDVSLGDSESIGLTYYFLGVACLIARTRFEKILTSVGTGFLVCCCLSKEPFMPCVGLTWVSCFLLRPRKETLQADVLDYVKRSAIGVGVVVVGLCLYMVPTGSMSHYLRMVKGYFRFYRDPMQSYCVVLGRFHPSTPLNDLLSQAARSREQFFNLPTLGFLAPFAAAFVVFVARRSLLLLATGFLGFVFAAYAVTASNCQWQHYYNMTMAGLFFALFLGLDSMTPYLKQATTRVFIGVVLVTAVLVQMGPRLENEIEAYGTRHFSDPYAEPVPQIRAIVAQHTKPTDRIFTTGMPALYVQTNRISAVRESAIIDEGLGFYEGKTDEEKLSGLRAELEQNMPKVVVLDPAHGARKQRHNRVLLMPFLTAHGYTQLTEYIWLRKD